MAHGTIPLYVMDEISCLKKLSTQVEFKTCDQSFLFTSSFLFQMIWNIFVSDLAQWHEVELSHSSTCSLLLHRLLSKLQKCPDLTKWSIILQNSDELIGEIYNVIQLIPRESRILIKLIYLTRQIQSRCVRPAVRRQIGRANRNFVACARLRFFYEFFTLN